MDTFLDNMRRGNNIDDLEDAAEQAIVGDNCRLVVIAITVYALDPQLFLSVKI